MVDAALVSSKKISDTAIPGFVGRIIEVAHEWTGLLPSMKWKREEAGEGMLVMSSVLVGRVRKHPHYEIWKGRVDK